MRFLSVTAALFASTSLAVPTYPDNGGGACVPKPPVGGSSSYSGGEPSSRYTSSAPGTEPTGTGTTSGPGGSSTTSRRTRTKPTHTKPTQTNTSSGPATTTTGSNTGSNTSTGPPTTSTGNTNPPGFKCPEGLYSNPQCCATDVLGVADLDCASPNGVPTSADNFRAICAAGGKQAKCCVAPLGDQAVLCQGIPSGGNPPGGNPPGGNPPGGNPPGGNPPGGNSPGSEIVCPSGLYSNAQCCATDVLGVADLDCRNPSTTPTAFSDFKLICAAAGQQAKCCVIPVAGQAVLCTEPLPGGNPPGGNPPGGNPPGGNPPGGAIGCPHGLYSNAQCCATDVLGVADIDCHSPSTAPSSPLNFREVCAASGNRARCCVLPILGQDVLCMDPVGIPQ